MTTANELMLIGVYAALCPALLGATVIDWRTRVLPNPLVLFIALTGLITQAFASGLIGGAVALSGALIGLIGLLPFYLLGGMAAGDVKLMAAVGAWFSPQGALLTVVLSILAGGVLGLLFVVARRRHEGLPYATAIAAGTFASLFYPRSVL
ncbi:MAG: prepilin peptidase [Steroidobacteraceae bacterium]